MKNLILLLTFFPSLFLQGSNLPNTAHKKPGVPTDLQTIFIPKEIFFKISSYFEPFEQLKMDLVTKNFINSPVREERIKKALNNFFLYPNKNLNDEKLITILNYNKEAEDFFYRNFLEKANSSYFDSSQAHTWPGNILHFSVDKTNKEILTCEIITYKKPIEAPVIQSVCTITYKNQLLSDVPNILQPLYKIWNTKNSLLRLIVDCSYDDDLGERDINPLILFTKNVFLHMEEYKIKYNTFYNSLKVIDFSSLFSWYFAHQASNFIASNSFLFTQTQFTCSIPLTFYIELYKDNTPLNPYIIPRPLYPLEITDSFEELKNFPAFWKVCAEKYDLGLEIINSMDLSNYSITEILKICKELQSYTSPFLKNNQGISQIELLLKLFLYLLDKNDFLQEMKVLIDFIEKICTTNPLKASFYRDYQHNSLLHIIFNLLRKNPNNPTKEFYYNILVNTFLRILKTNINSKNFTGQTPLEIFMLSIVDKNVLSPSTILQILNCFGRENADFQLRFSSGETLLYWVKHRLESNKLLPLSTPFQKTHNVSHVFPIRDNKKIQLFEDILKYILSNLNKTITLNYPY